MSFIPATSLDETFVCLLAFLVFLANLKLLMIQLMRLNHRIYLFTKTLSKAALPLFSFLVVFLTILMDSFAEVQADEHLKFKDYEVVEYMLRQFRYFFVKTGKVGSVSENDASSEGEVNLTKAANRVQSGGESIACDSTEGNSLEVTVEKEQTAVKHDHGSFSSLRTLLDPSHLRHDAYQDEEDVSSTWPSLSLPKSNTRYVDNKEPLPYLGEPAENVTEGQTSDIPAESDHGSSRKPFFSLAKW